MRRFFILCTALMLVTPCMVGCDKAKTERKETVTTPGGTTTTTNKVESTGENPPPNSSGETAK